jgi:hypothetical protein
VAVFVPTGTDRSLAVTNVMVLVLAVKLAVAARVKFWLNDDESRPQNAALVRK